MSCVARAGGVIAVTRVGLALAVALALAGCLFEGAPRPATPTPVPPTSTPTPTVQARVVLPTAVPTRTPTAGPTPVAELRGAGQLLYAGSFAGRRGLFLIGADGGDRRLLAEGNYHLGVWAPDGERFAAVGVPSAEGASRLDLFTAGGRLLRQVDFAGFLFEPLWAPDARRLAVAAGEHLATTTWLLDEDRTIEVRLGSRTRPIGWLTDGRLALVVTRGGEGRLGTDASDRQQLWTVDADGRDARELTEQLYGSEHWASEGTTVYTLGDARPHVSLNGEIRPIAESVLAIDTGSGMRRAVVTLDGVLAQLGQGADPTLLRWFNAFSVAPRGDRLAVWLLTERRAGGTLAPQLVIVDRDGRVIGQDRLAVGFFPTGGDWTAVGGRFAYGSGSGSNGDTRVLTIDGTSDPAGIVVLENGGALPQWSRDGQWLAFERAGRIEIAASRPPPRSWVVNAHDSSAPRLFEWRPAR